MYCCRTRRSIFYEKRCYSGGCSDQEHNDALEMTQHEYGRWRARARGRTTGHVRPARTKAPAEERRCTLCTYVYRIRNGCRAGAKVRGRGVANINKTIIVRGARASVSLMYGGRRWRERDGDAHRAEARDEKDTVEPRGGGREARTEDIKNGGVRS